MGSLFDSRQTVTQDPGAAAAWSIAQPTQQYVNQAGTQFTQGVMSNPAYAGQRVADLNPYQTNAANTLGQFSQATSGIPNLFNSSGTTALNAGNTYGANAQNLYNQYAGADPTGQILGAANQYANNPYVNGMIDASNRDVARSLAEQDLPGIDRAASGTGNLNSSRAGVQSAIAARGASDRMADIASQIRSQFFGQGLGMAQNQYNQNLQNSLAANNQLLSSGQYGANLLGMGQQYAGNNFNQGNTAGSLFQTQNQNQLNANKSYFDESLANQLAALQGLSGIAANTTAKTTANVSTNPSYASQIGGALSGFADLGGLSGLKSLF
jgi:hypothetical protein